MRPAPTPEGLGLAGRYDFPDTRVSSLLRSFADESGWGLQLRFAVDLDEPLDEPARR
ncbi:hypothetical protein SAMN02745121_01455 [Nannocystis exedens]|uniref:Uncharacterized protein n=1 Tax=Nannocystis exedens TaxID=54 RepID=A0A1I1V0X2_9BACT|nr:hypothetical protein [Nannocystis exedens]PCC72255.1 hypothetical protein NAEX_05334 [Nannocystis exedens]SFD76465.1 hypothetical protein SAMN02745121_01455 [Nannocystis exedens]